jgi:hypothetical protein
VLDEPLTGGLGTPVACNRTRRSYIAKVYRGVVVELDIQYIINPGRTSRTHNALSFGFQFSRDVLITIFSVVGSWDERTPCASII